MRKYRYNRQARAQVLQDGVGDIERQRRVAFAQHQQAGDMIDLRVHGDDRGNAAVARAPRRLQFRMRRDLREQIGRRVHEQPVVARRADNDR